MEMIPRQRYILPDAEAAAREDREQREKVRWRAMELAGAEVLVPLCCAVARRGTPRMSNLEQPHGMLVCAHGMLVRLLPASASAGLRADSAVSSSASACEPSLASRASMAPRASRSSDG